MFLGKFKTSENGLVMLFFEDWIANLQQEQSNIIKSAKNINLQAKIQLAEKIETISDIASIKCDTNIKNIRKTRHKEQKKMHLDFVKEGGFNE